MAQRLRGRFGYSHDAPFRVTFHRDRLDQPQRWKRPRRVFVCSMGDLWHPDVEAVDRAAVIRATNLAPQHTYLFLTKRPERFDGDWSGQANFWLGTTVEDQQRADERIPHLLRAKAVVRFLSIEPMLGPVDFYTSWLARYRSRCSGLRYMNPKAAGSHDVLPGIDWVIIGCESGPVRRDCDPAWMMAVVAQCQKAGVPVLVKQVAMAGRVSKDPAEWPQRLRVREYPLRGVAADCAAGVSASKGHG
jgi:protein gp37